MSLRDNSRKPLISSDKTSEEHLPLAHADTASSGSTEICTLFREGKCPHRIGGKKLIDSQVCSKSHPKACRMFVRSGTLKKWGCKKGENCSRYHPPHCSTSLANKTCYDPNCTRPHLFGTKRKNEQNTQKEPTTQQPPGVGPARPIQPIHQVMLVVKNVRHIDVLKNKDAHKLVQIVQ